MKELKSMENSAELHLINMHKMSDNIQSNSIIHICQSILGVYITEMRLVIYQHQMQPEWYKLYNHKKNSNGESTVLV